MRCPQTWRTCALLLLGLLSVGSTATATAAEVCPARPGQPLRFVDVFDGPAEELAYLIPDPARARSGSWQLGYVYDAGRSVTIHCRYADGEVVETRLTSRVERCDYRMDSKKQLSLSCR